MRGARVYFFQRGTGTLSIAYLGGVLFSSPNLSTNPRPLSGRFAKAVAEYTGDGSGSGNDHWTITGELG